MMSDNLRYNLKKILKKLKILKNNSPDWKKVISLNKKIYEELKIKAKKGQKFYFIQGRSKYTTKERL